MAEIVTAPDPTDGPKSVSDRAMLHDARFVLVDFIPNYDPGIDRVLWNDNGTIRVSGLGPAIVLSASSHPENSAEGTLIGTLSVNNPEGSYTFSLTNTAGGRAKIVGTSLQVGATASNAEAVSSYQVTIHADNGAGGTIDKIVTITVSDVNEFTPVITSNGGGPTAAISIPENSTAVTTVTATDGDLTASKTFSIVGGADAARFAINSATGALSFVSAPNYEAPNDADTNNIYVVIVQVSDGTNVDTQTISVTVTNVNEFTPVITSNGGGSTASVTVAENTIAVTSVVATDADAGATITYSIVGGADAGKFAINSSTGFLSFAAPPDYETPTDSNGDNAYVVIVQASDGTNAVTQTITATVINANDNAPVITSNGGGSTAAISVPENSTAVTTVVATDADVGTPITYSISGGADAARFAINSSTGVLTFASAPNYEAPTDANGDNAYIVIVQASDGTNTDTQTITVTVTDVAEGGPPPTTSLDFSNPANSQYLALLEDI